ncbi:YIP1 family protein [Rhodobacterales bacterium HKCCE3408]|nr:YIP1 family protein [Rhodobacterales bacterium HKCCE3408]
MAVTTDILASYRRPRRVFAGIRARGGGERLALVYLMAAMVLGFVSQLPSVQRRSILPAPELEAAIRAESADVRPIEGLDVPANMVDAKFQALMSAELVVWFLILPLAFYLLALVGYGLARLLGVRLSGLDARLALFWALLAAIPLKLLHGLVAGLIGAGAAQTTVGILWLVVFLWFWISNLREAGQGAA